MSSKNETHTQHDATQVWNQIVTEQMAQFESLVGELTKLQKTGVERTTQAIDELASLSRATVGYIAELSERWREMTLTAARTAAGAASATK